MSSLATRKNRREDEEDAAQLRLGQEFATAGCLSVSEVKLLLEQARENREKPENTVFRKTEEYVNAFSRFNDSEQLYAIRQIFTSGSEVMQQFEITQLLNICPETSEEAKAVVPSLARIDDEVLQEMLSELIQQRSFKAGV